MLKYFRVSINFQDFIISLRNTAAKCGEFRAAYFCQCLKISVDHFTGNIEFDEMSTTIIINKISTTQFLSPWGCRYLLNSFWDLDRAAYLMYISILLTFINLLIKQFQITYCILQVIYDLFDNGSLETGSAIVIFLFSNCTWITGTSKFLPLIWHILQLVNIW